jgi:hypothetical protein
MRDRLEPGHSGVELKNLGRGGVWIARPSPGGEFCLPQKQVVPTA